MTMTKCIKPITIHSVGSLRDLDKEIRQLLKTHIENEKTTPTAFAKKVGIHPAQMIGFLKGEKGILIETISKIGKNS